jgi:hypothetical protein
VPVEKERASSPATKCPDEAAATLVGDEWNPAVGVRRETLRARLDRPHVEAEPVQALLDELLCGLLVPEEARNPDELP